MAKIKINKGIYLDDIRDPDPKYWIVCRNAYEFLNMVQMYEFEEYSFDHDLNNSLNLFDGGDIIEEITGYDVLKWSAANIPKTAKVRFHSANLPARQRMLEWWTNYIDENC